MPQINLQPDVLDLILYAGDGVSIPLVCTDKTGAPVDVTGAINAQIRLERLSPDPPVVSFTVNAVDAYLGKVIISLSGAQTAELLNGTGKFSGVWDVQWTPSGSEPRTLCQGKVECVSDVTR